MIDGSVEPVLILAIGNQLLSDDGVGMVILEELSRRGGWGGAVDLVDGGTQGLMLLSQISGRPAVILLDAISLGAEPGTVHVLGASDVLRFGAGGPTAHEANAGELLRAAMLTGDLPENVCVVGIEPENLSTGIGLSSRVADAVAVAVERVVELVGPLASRARLRDYLGIRNTARGLFEVEK